MGNCFGTPKSTGARGRGAATDTAAPVPISLTVPTDAVDHNGVLHTFEEDPRVKEIKEKYEKELEQVRNEVEKKKQMQIQQQMQQQQQQQQMQQRGKTQHNEGATRSNSVTDDTTASTGSAAHRRVIVVSLYSYTGRVEAELSYEKGARFEVLDESDRDWWFVCNLATQEEGFVYADYVVLATSLEAQDWYFGKISRKEAEKILQKDPSLPTGTYLVRVSDASTHPYSLSMKNGSGPCLDVKHHRIREVNDRYFIQEAITFRTLQDLINHYQEHQTGNKLLTMVCPKPLPTQWDLSVETKDQWEIDRTTLSTTQLLGSGFFGDVWHGYWNETRDVAIKTLKEDTMSAKAFLEEASIMKRLRHPNILILYAVCSTEEPILIVTEYMNKGALLDVLRKDGMRLEFGELVEICAQVASGMAYLEEMGLIHRDLAARNVLVDSNKLCKVADFGLARIVDDGQYNPATCKSFPVKWTAPEAMLYTTYTIKSDVWSFGILMMEVMTLGAVPYPGMTNQEVVEMVPNGYRMSKPAHPVTCPDGLFELITKCWKREPEDRLTFENLASFLIDFTVSSEISYDDKEFGN